MLACFNVKENKQKIIVGLSQMLSFLQNPSFRQAQFDLIGQLTQRRTPQALIGNVTTLTIIMSFSFKNKIKNS